MDYPGIGPEHAFLRDSKRAEYQDITDKEAVEAFLMLSKAEGIIPAIESAHAVAYAVKLAKNTVITSYSIHYTKLYESGDAYIIIY